MLEDSFATIKIGQRYFNALVEAAWSENRRIQIIGSVGGGNGQYLMFAESVHLHKQGIQGSIHFVLPAAPGVMRSFRGDGIKFINKYNGWFAASACLLINGTNALGAQTDPDLHKVSSGEREELHSGFICNCLGQHGLTGARFANQQNALNRFEPGFFDK